MKRIAIKQNPDATREWHQRSRTALKRSGGLARQSKQAASDARELAAIKREMLSIDPLCRRCRRGGEMDLHHRAGRENWRRLYRPLLTILCSECHPLCKSQSKMMEATGWVLSRFIDWREREIPETVGIREISNDI